MHIIIAVLIALMIASCGGGGSGGGSGDTDRDTINDRAERDLAFQDEALERVLDRADVSCTEVFCAGDAEISPGENSRTGMVFTACQYSCLPVEIDFEETRHYQVRLLWRRTVQTCYRHDRYEIMILAWVQIPCIPTQ